MTKTESRQQLNQLKAEIKQKVKIYNLAAKGHNKTFKDKRAKLDLVNA